jgi:putative flippase GtrA
VANSLTALIGHKNAQETKQFVRFLAAGCFNTGVGLVIYCLGILLGLNYVVANSIAWVIGVIVAFLLNARFVFRKPYGRAQFLMFLGSNVVALIASLAFLTLLIKVFLVNAIIASVVSIPLVVAVNYLAAKFVVFR